MILQQGNAVAFQNTMSTEWVAVAAVKTFLYLRFVLVGTKNNNNNKAILRCPQPVYGAMSVTALIGLVILIFNILTSIYHT